MEFLLRIIYKQSLENKVHILNERQTHSVGR